MLSEQNLEKTPGWLLLVAILCVAPMAILQGWVMSVLWRWFIVPTFGLGEISIPVAIGITLFVSVVRPPHTPGKMTCDLLIQGISESIAFSIIMLLIGLIVRLWM